MDGGLAFWLFGDYLAVWMGELVWWCGIEALMGSLGEMMRKWPGAMVFRGDRLVVL